MKYFRLPFKGDGEGSYIFDKNEQMVAQIRGWGWLQYKGEDVAIEEQQTTQDFIVDACNSVGALREEVERLRELLLPFLDEEEKVREALAGMLLKLHEAQLLEAKK